MCNIFLCIYNSVWAGWFVFALDAPLCYIQIWRRSQGCDAVVCFWSRVFLAWGLATYYYGCKYEVKSVQCFRGMDHAHVTASRR